MTDHTCDVLESIIVQHQMVPLTVGGTNSHNPLANGYGCLCGEKTRPQKTETGEPIHSDWHQQHLLDLLAAHVAEALAEKDAEIADLTKVAENALEAGDSALASGKRAVKDGNTLLELNTKIRAEIDGLRTALAREQTTSTRDRERLALRVQESTTARTERDAALARLGAIAALREEYIRRDATGSPMLSTSDTVTDLTAILADSSGAIAEREREIREAAFDEGVKAAGAYGHEDDWTHDVNPYLDNPYRAKTSPTCTCGAVEYGAMTQHLIPCPSALVQRQEGE